MKKPKTRILKNGNNQYIAQIKLGTWPFTTWYYLSYFPNNGHIYKLLARFGTPRNEFSRYDDSLVVQELFDIQEEAQAVLDKYLADITFNEVK
jgi:hypothetical protein